MEHTVECQGCLATVTHILKAGVRIPTEAEDPDWDLCEACIDERDDAIEEAAEMEGVA